MWFSVFKHNTVSHMKHMHLPTSDLNMEMNSTKNTSQCPLQFMQCFVRFDNHCAVRSCHFSLYILVMDCVKCPALSLGLLNRLHFDLPVFVLYCSVTKTSVLFLHHGASFIKCVRTDLIVKRADAKIHGNVHIYRNGLWRGEVLNAVYALLLVLVLQVFGNISDSCRL